MAKILGYNPPPEVEELIARSLMKSWTSNEMRLVLANRKASDYKLNTIAGRSRLAVCGAIWRALLPEERAWYAQEGAKQGVSGWHLAVMNFCAASKQFDEIYIPAQDNRSGNAGCIYSPQFGKTIRIRQGHPRSYYTKQKVVGTRSRFEPVLTHEPVPDIFTHDFFYSMGAITDGYNIHPQQAECGSNFSIKAIWRSYYGQFRGHVYTDQESQFYFPVYLEHEQGSESPYPENYAGYDYIFEVHDYKGIFLFDSLKLEHNGYNWAIDWRCKQIEKVNRGHLAICRNAWEIEKTYTGAKVFSRTYFAPD